MKILHGADFHLETKTYGRYMSFIEKFQMFCSLLKEVDVGVIPGDLVHCTRPSYKTLMYIIVALRIASSYCRLIITTGNHDASDDLYRLLDEVLSPYGVHVVYKVPQRIEIEGKSFFVVPWKTGPINEKLQEADYLVIHAGVEGHPYCVNFPRNLDLKTVGECYDKVFCGHIHGQFRKENVFYPGSVDFVSFRDEGPFGFFLYDNNNVDFIEIPTKERVYLTFDYPFEESDVLTSLKEHKEDIVKLVLRNVPRDVRLPKFDTALLEIQYADTFAQKTMPLISVEEAWESYCEDPTVKNFVLDLFHQARG